MFLIFIHFFRHWFKNGWLVSSNNEGLILSQNRFINKIRRCISLQSYHHFYLIAIGYFSYKFKCSTNISIILTYKEISHLFKNYKNFKNYIPPPPKLFIILIIETVPLTNQNEEHGQHNILCVCNLKQRETFVTLCSI